MDANERRPLPKSWRQTAKRAVLEAMSISAAAFNINLGRWFDRPPANEKPRLEPRRNWPRDSLCAAPWAPIDGRRGARVDVDITHLGGRKHLPVVRLKRTG